MDSNECWNHFMFIRVSRVRAVILNEHGILHIYYGTKVPRALVSFFCLLQSATSYAHMLFCLDFFHFSQFSAFCLLFVMYSSSLTKNNMNWLLRSQNVIQYYRKQCMQIKYTANERERFFSKAILFDGTVTQFFFVRLFLVRQRVSR